MKLRAENSPNGAASACRGSTHFLTHRSTFVFLVLIQLSILRLIIPEPIRNFISELRIL